MTSGLTRAQVEARRARGQANVVSASSSRTVWSILRANVLTRFNAIIGVLLVVVSSSGKRQLSHSIMSTAPVVMIVCQNSILLSPSKINSLRLRTSRTCCVHARVGNGF
jgi:hypothetical protein